MAKVAGIAASTVQAIWKAHGLSPHRWRHFKLSNDPAFTEKLVNIVGLYVDPPAHAVVLSVDEKSQIQALDRTQPGLPMKKGRAWLDRHPRWTSNFTPTSCSWLNAVEGFFAKLTRRRLKHGVFHSVVDLQAAINRFIREYNADNPKPFIWKANPDGIIAARNRGFQTLESIH